MPLTLNEKEKRSIAAMIQERMDEHLSRFPFARYPIEPLDEWKQIFCDPKAVTPATLKQALGWHFGDWQRKDLSSMHRKTIYAILTSWREFTETAEQNSVQTLHFWQQSSQIGSMVSTP